MTKAVKKTSLTNGIITLCLAALGLVLYLMSFTTNYYPYGGQNSVLITVLIAGAMLCACADPTRWITPSRPAGSCRRRSGRSTSPL